MNAVEIEEAVSALAEAPFDAEEFPFQFLAAFGNKATTIKRLRSGSTNKSDVVGGILQRNNIHIAVCEPGFVEATLPALRESSATESQKAKYILVTDGRTLEAESLDDGETLACCFPELADHFGFFLPLAGITTVKQIRENAFDIKATSRLNKLYVELLKENPEWEERREDLNHFFARLIFCFFAEDTGIFADNLFTKTIETMSASDSSNTHEIIAELFHAMNTPSQHEGKPDDRYRDAAKVRNWARPCPYVNGGLFTGSLDVPRFSKIARSYLIHIGNLDWTKINPDIFGSMIQAVAEDDERGELGMHYTSVPNILKVLNPLFLDELREKLLEADDNPRKLLNIRNRMARIRVFDPACGSGNFLVIAYKEMRAIEAEINRRREEGERASDIPLTNFRGIEIRHFAAEIARLALIIAEYQCDVLYRSPKLALAEFLPLEALNWITHGNALQLEWSSVCPPTGTNVKRFGTDLYDSSLDQQDVDFENRGGVTYICGNPPYLGSSLQSKEQKKELERVLARHTSKWRSLDYVSGWIFKAAEYGVVTETHSAFVATNSICQGQQVAVLWPLIFDFGVSITFAHTSFKWSNLAAKNAGVTVIIVGLSSQRPNQRRLFSLDENGEYAEQIVEHINAYLVPFRDVFVDKKDDPLRMAWSVDAGGKPVEGGNLLLSFKERNQLLAEEPDSVNFIKRVYGASEYAKGQVRFCLWIDDDRAVAASEIPAIRTRLKRVSEMRRGSRKESTRQLADRPYRFGEVKQIGREQILFIPTLTSESRQYIPAGLLPEGCIITNAAFGLFDAPLWNLAVLNARIHFIWIATVCGKLETRYRYSNTLGWNTFPVPPLTEQNKTDLTRCAENILLAREAHWPATIAELYDPVKMPDDLRNAHQRNDETLERIYIGRCFKNDTERLEKLFEMYTQMTAKAGAE